MKHFFHRLFQGFTCFLMVTLMTPMVYAKHHEPHHEKTTPEQTAATSGAIGGGVSATVGVTAAHLMKNKSESSELKRIADALVRLGTADP